MALEKTRAIKTLETNIWTKLDFGAVGVNKRTSVRKDSSCEMFVEILITSCLRRKKTNKEKTDSVFNPLLN